MIQREGCGIGLRCRSSPFAGRKTRRNTKVAVVGLGAESQESLCGKKKNITSYDDPETGVFYGEKAGMEIDVFRNSEKA